ncbi:MAG TPA: DUF488 family protein [Burkholderiaceae bacterium]|jgi:uncharacterized protein YeaO (DUF488 family)|nr:DUF488 family protein [Burkholderiaceae bacterium]
MSIRVVRLGTPRSADEGLRLGTVRRPPRGVAKVDFSRLDWYDAWLPELSPSAELVKLAQAAQSDAEWAAFARRYRAEMGKPEAEHLLGLLAALSRHTALSVGCYCERDDRCHRSILRVLLKEHGADMA